PIPTCFPYTTLFRSRDLALLRQEALQERVRFELANLLASTETIDQPVHVASADGQATPRLVGLRVSKPGGCAVLLEVSLPQRLRSEEHTSELQSREN